MLCTNELNAHYYQHNITQNYIIHLTFNNLVCKVVYNNQPNHFALKLKITTHLLNQINPNGNETIHTQRYEKITHKLI